MSILKDRKFAFSVLIFVMMVILTGCTDTNSLRKSGNSRVTTEPSTVDPVNEPTGISARPLLNLIPSETKVGFRGEVILLAEAFDPEGGQLSFSWAAQEGVFIRQSGNQATWQAPESMVRAKLGVMVENSRGTMSSATAFIDVIGGRQFSLEIMFNRSSLFSAVREYAGSSEWMPLQQARVTIPSLAAVAVTDSQGKANFAIDDGVPVASSAEILVQYLDWEIRYTALFPHFSNKISDSILFYPGYDGVTVAVAKGDSFTYRRGGVEVVPYEFSNGKKMKVSDVTVDVGSRQVVARSGSAFFSIPELTGSTNLRLSKTGYESIDGLQIPLTPDGLTIIHAKMRANGTVSSSEAVISWLKPFNGAVAFPVYGTFEVGFGQGMDRTTIFEDIQLTIQNQNSNSVVILSGDGIEKYFNISWFGNTILRLTPRNPLRALSKYSLIINHWNTRALDGRILKNYTGMFGTFTTDFDDQPAISSTSPNNGDTCIPLWGPFLIRFNRPMNPATLNDNLLISITNSYSGAKVSINGIGLSEHFDVVWSEENTLLSMVPKKQLKQNTPYLVKLESTGLKSQSGKAITNIANTWGSFTTGEF